MRTRGQAKLEQAQARAPPLILQPPEVLSEVSAGEGGGQGGDEEARQEVLRDALPHQHHLQLDEGDVQAARSKHAPRSPSAALDQVEQHFDFPSKSRHQAPPGGRRSSMATSTPKGPFIRRVRPFINSSTISTIRQSDEEASQSAQGQSNVSTSSESSSFLENREVTSDETSPHTPLCHSSTHIIDPADQVGDVPLIANNDSSPPTPAVPPCNAALAQRAAMDETTTSRNLSIIAHKDEGSYRLSSDSDVSFYVNDRLPGRMMRVRTFQLPFLKQFKSQPDHTLDSLLLIPDQVASESFSSPAPSPQERPVRRFVLRRPHEN